MIPTKLAKCVSVAMFATTIFFPGAASAAAIGRIAKLQGKAWTVKAGQASPIAEGAPITSGDVIRTAGDGRAIIRLGDKDSAILVKPNSEITLNEVGGGDWSASLKNGGALFRVKNPAGRPNHLTVKTKVATMGVRGTTFFVEDDGKRPVFFCACNGSVALSDDHGGTKVFTTKHHDSPTDIAAGGEALASRASATKRTGPDYDHSDAEIEELNQVIDSP